MSMLALRCPRCGVNLYAAPTDRVQLAGCGRCGGVFLDQASTRRAFERLEAEVQALSTQVSGARDAQVRVESSAPAGPCPVCAQPMTPRRVEMAQLTVDDCAMHGTWFDHDELERWMTALASMRKSSISSGQVAIGAAAVTAGAVATMHAADAHAAADAAASSGLSAGDVIETGVEVVSAGADLAEIFGGLFELLTGIFE